jgi:hypothetical protein
MAKIKLEVESLVSDGLQGFNQLGTSIEDLNGEVNAFKKDSKTAFGGAAKEVKVYDDSIKKSTEDTKKLDDGVKAVGKSANKLQELKKQVKEYISAAATAKANGDILGFEKNIKAAGNLRDEIKDIQSAVGALTGNVGENLAGAFGRATQIGANGFEAVISAQALFGEENKDVQKQLLKLQAISSLSRLAGEFADVGDRLSEIKTGLAPIANLYTKANSSLINFAKTADFSFSGIAKGTAGLFKSIGSGIAGFVKSGIAGIRTLGATLAANPFGLILIAITAIIAIMVALKDKVKPIGALFDLIGEAIDSVLDSLEKFGQLIGIVDSEYEKQTKNFLANTQKQLDAITDRYDKEIQLTEAAGGKTVELEKKKQAALLERVIQSIALLKAKFQLEGKLSKEEFEQFAELEKQKKDIIFESVLINTKANKEKRDEEIKAEKERQARQKEAADKLKQLQKDLQAALFDLQKRAIQASADLETGEERLAILKKISDDEIQVLRDTITAKGKLTNANFKLTAEQEQQFATIQQLANKKYADEIINIEVEKANRLAEEQKKTIDNDLKFFELQARLRIAAVNNAQRPDGVSEELFELQKQRNILIIQKQSAQEQLDFKKQTLEKEAQVQITASQNELLQLFGKDDELSNIKRDQANKNIDTIKSNLQLETNVLIAETDAQIKTLGEQIEASSDKINAKGKLIDWQGLLGLSDKEFQQFKQGFDAIKSEFQNLTNGLFELANQQLDNELSAIDKRIAARDIETQALQDKLEKEQGLADQGLANNTDRLKKEIAQKEEQRQKDLAQQKAIFEKKKKLAYAQFAIDTAIQASNLVTAVSEVFVTYAAVPYVAAALAALMVASFAVTKIAAFNAIKNDTGGFKEGGYTGNIGTNEVAGDVHGQEFVHTAEKTKKYRTLFEGIHNDDNRMVELGLLELLKDTGVTLPQESSTRMSNAKDLMRTQQTRVVVQKPDERLTAIEKNVSKIERQSREKTFIDVNGNVHIKRGNHTRIIRKHE